MSETFHERFRYNMTWIFIMSSNVSLLESHRMSDKIKEENPGTEGRGSLISECNKPTSNEVISLAKKSEDPRLEQLATRDRYLALIKRESLTGHCLCI